MTYKQELMIVGWIALVAGEIAKVGKDTAGLYIFTAVASLFFIVSFFSHE